MRVGNYTIIIIIYKDFLWLDKTNLNKVYFKYCKKYN